MKPFVIKKRIYLLILLVLLCLTSFIKDCDGPFSVGFIYPLFDIEPDLTISYPYNIFLSVIFTFAFIAAGAILILMINVERWWKVLSKVSISLMINIFLFNIVLVEGFLIELTSYIYVYYLCYPISYIEEFFEGLRIYFEDWNVLSRIYFILSTGVIYLIIVLIEKIRKKLASEFNSSASIKKTVILKKHQ